MPYIIGVATATGKFAKCQFSECQSADFESLVHASLLTEVTKSTQSLTPLSADHIVRTAVQGCWEPSEPGETVRY